MQNRMSHEPAPPLSPELSPAAALLHRQIVERLQDLVARRYASCLDPAFVSTYAEALSLFERFQNQRLADEDKRPVCAPGCSACCFHWVEDVCSFEAELAADYVRRACPQIIPAAIAQFRDDEAQLAALEQEVSRRIAADPSIRRTMEATGWDEVDLMLSSFYRLRRPCAFLDDNRTCRIYPVRPLTCRIYLSLHNPAHCDPQYVDDNEVTTFLLDMDEEANGLLDKLHFLYDRHDGDTGLRSLMATLLAADPTLPLPKDNP